MSIPRGKTALECATERFWLRVSKGENCWEWGGRKDKDGYGILMMDCKRWRAHRFSYLLFHGVCPSEMCVLHCCDNPACVRPDHLFLGDNADNLRDMRAKGRDNTPRGEGHSSHRLTENQVREILELSRVVGYKRIAKIYGVGNTTVRNILRRKTWKHVRLDIASALDAAPDMDAE